MAGNRFESSRIVEGTLLTGAQHNGDVQEECNAVSRDDVRDGFAEPAALNMVAEGSPALENPVMPAPHDANRLLRATQLIGEKVQNLAGEDLGKIEEMMVEPSTGRVVWSILSFGGFLGIGDNFFPVPWSALRVDPAAGQIVLDIGRDVLERAPRVDKESWPKMGDPDFGREVNEHYDRGRHWEHRVTDSGDFTGTPITPDRSREYEVTSDYRNVKRH